MRWNLIKQAWKLARDSFPNKKRLFVDLPDVFLTQGECAVVDLDDAKTVLGKITYTTACREGDPVIILAMKTQQEVKLPRLAAVGMQCLVKEAKRKPKYMFEDREKVRIQDPISMEYNEGGQILGMSRDKDGRAWYSVMVDGSSKPSAFREEQLRKNMVGTVDDISSVDSKPIPFNLLKRRQNAK